MAASGTGDLDYLGWDSIYMLEISIFPVIVGSVLGFLSGLGVGGGSLLILWLTLVLKTEYASARCINLLFFLPSALIACLFRWKQGSLPVKQLIPAMIIGCLSAAITSFWGIQLDRSILKKLFGGLLLLTGMRELMYKPKEKQAEQQ